MSAYSMVSLLAATMFVVLLVLVGRPIAKHGLVTIFYPPIFLIIFFMLFFLAPVSIALLVQDTLIYRYNPLGYAPESWLAALLFAISFILTASAVSIKVTSVKYFMRQTYNLRQRLRKVGKRRIDVFYIIIFYAIPFISLIYILTKFGGSNYQDYLPNRTIERKGMGFIIMPSTWLTISITVALFAAITRFRPRRGLVYIVPLLVAFILAQLFLGSKSRGLIIVVYTILTWGLYSTFQSRFPLKITIHILLVALTVSAMGLFFGDIREATVRQSNVLEINTRLAVSSLFSKFNAFGAVENTVWLVENASFDELIGGRSFFAVVVGGVPRSIWAGKPLGGGPELRNMIHPGSYDLESGFQLTSYSPGIIAEAYMNFGFSGLLIVAPLFGLGFALLARFLSIVDTPLLLVIYVILLYRMTYMLTGEVFGSVSGIFMTLFPLVLYIGLRRGAALRCWRESPTWA